MSEGLRLQGDCLHDTPSDAEEARWQKRIEQVIRSAGLETFDASGNESGDALDWSADQIAHALGELQERIAVLKEAGQVLADAVEDHLSLPLERDGFDAIRGAQIWMDAALGERSGENPAPSTKVDA